MQLPGIVILVATILGSSLAFIDASIVNVILPRIQTQFGEKLSSAQWVVQAYGLFLSTFLLLGGALGDHFGRKRVFQAGLLVFITGSAGCAVAPSFAVLLLARALQGLGAAWMTPQSLAIIQASFAEKERARAVGTWSAFSAISGAIGPPLGGWLSDTWGWRMAFLINLPLGLIALGIAGRSFPKDCRESRSASLDWRGTIASTLGIGALILALSEKSALLGALGALILGGFILIERRVALPLLPLSTFRSRVFTLTNSLTLALYAALGGAFFYLPLHLISAEGYTSGRAGLALLPVVLLVFSLSRAAGTLLPRMGARAMLALGPLTIGLGFLGVARLWRPGATYWQAYFPGLIIVGLGLSLTVAPLTTTVLGALEDSRTGLSSGLNNAVARVAGLFGVALVTLEAGQTGAPALPEILSVMAGLCGLAAILGAGLPSRALK